MNKNQKIKNLDNVVIKFAGDSGDGMQLIGTLFSDTAALSGNDIATFPDYPAEIRAPQNTVAGVSGFQVHAASTKIFTPGDYFDVLVAMNPASLKANLKWTKKGATIIVNTDSFDDKAIEKAGYKNNPIDDNSLSSYNLIKAPINTIIKENLKDTNIDNKTIDRVKNMFALGMLYFMFDKKFEITFNYIEKHFAKKPELIEYNKKTLLAGYNYAETIEAISYQNKITASKELEKGKYRSISGNIATAWGLLAASERSGRQLFLGSYPITPATEILQELAKHKFLGAKVFQAEDEIAGICSAIGASFAGAMACTTTSGPGLSLKSEAIGLAVMVELPLIIVNVQRGGPSTGLPTKSEQADLYQALFGRNGECPVIVIAASTSANCFYFAYTAAKLSMEHMTPVILLTDGYIANGSQLFKIPEVKSLPPINPPIVKPNTTYKPFERDPVKLTRGWAIAGTEGLRHRVGGLEKENISGAVSNDPLNHQLMVELRQKKIDIVANYIPEQTIMGEPEGELLVISWGGTEGAVASAVSELQEKGKKVSLAHFNYIMPLPKNTKDIFGRFKKLLVCELNMGQFVNYLRMILPDFKYKQFNKVQGQPFLITELTDIINKTLEEK
ncbi:MAG: 2-oxoacid:acceptor oxidoreductase subunit alpha [Bacteroidales bacterium]|nr:2-oxoacid:acceptor oxidoreductase subunit alpha [Bacteroidales bacterium]